MICVDRNGATTHETIKSGTTHGFTILSCSKTNSPLGTMRHKYMAVWQAGYCKPFFSLVHLVCNDEAKMDAWITLYINGFPVDNK